MQLLRFYNDPDFGFFTPSEHNIISNLFKWRVWHFRSVSVAFQAIWTFINGAKINTALSALCRVPGCSMVEQRDSACRQRVISTPVRECRETPRDVPTKKAQGQDRQVCMCWQYFCLKMSRKQQYALAEDEKLCGFQWAPTMTSLVSLQGFQWQLHWLIHHKLIHRGRHKGKRHQQRPKGFKVGAVKSSRKERLAPPCFDSTPLHSRCSAPTNSTSNRFCSFSWQTRLLLDQNQWINFASSFHRKMQNASLW